MSKMSNEEALRRIKAECEGCCHPQAMEYCERNCEAGIAIKCIENWSRVCEWIDSDSVEDIAKYVHRYGVEYIIECIEKHTPKEAKSRVSGNGWNDWLVFTCPACGKEFKDTLVCPKCHQVVTLAKESDNE